MEVKVDDVYKWMTGEVSVQRGYDWLNTASALPAVWSHAIYFYIVQVSHPCSNIRTTIALNTVILVPLLSSLLYKTSDFIATFGLGVVNVLVRTTESIPWLLWADIFFPHQALKHCLKSQQNLDCFSIQHYWNVYILARKLQVFIDHNPVSLTQINNAGSMESTCIIKSALQTYNHSLIYAHFLLW